MLNTFHYGALVLMIICGCVVIYGIISLAKKWKFIPSGGHVKFILQLSGIISSGLVCYIVFLITGLFLDITPKKIEAAKDSYDFHLVDNIGIRETKTTEQKNDIATDFTYTEVDFYGEWYCETPPQKITENFEIKGSKDTYIFYDNNTYEINFIVTGQEDAPAKYRGGFWVLNSNIIITVEYEGIAGERWIETKSLAQGPFTYPYKFFGDGRLQINDDIYTKVERGN